VNEELIPTELKQRKQWVLWKLTDKGKVPFRVNGLAADKTNVMHWASFNEVVNALNDDVLEEFDGIGYVFSSSDPYTGIDLDDCFVDGGLTEQARSIVESLNSYTERSPSGKGLHILVKATKPGPRCKNSKKDIEMYDEAAYFTVTGDYLEGTPRTIGQRQQEVNAL